MGYRTRRFVFLNRLIGASGRDARGEVHALELLSVEELFPTEIDDAKVELRPLNDEERERWLGPIELVEADFLGPVFGGFELSFACDELEIDEALMAQLAQAAWSCGGPVIRAGDGAIRQAVDLVSFAAERLCGATTGSGCFGQDLLLRLPHCEVYEAHVREAVRATLAGRGKAHVHAERRQRPAYQGARRELIGNK